MRNAGVRGDDGSRVATASGPNRHFQSPFFLLEVASFQRHLARIREREQYELLQLRASCVTRHPPRAPAPITSSVASYFSTDVSIFLLGRSHMDIISRFQDHSRVVCTQRASSCEADQTAVFRSHVFHRRSSVSDGVKHESKGANKTGCSTSGLLVPAPAEQITFSVGLLPAGVATSRCPHNLQVSLCTSTTGHLEEGAGANAASITDRPTW